MSIKHHLPLVGRLYKQRDKARKERDAAIQQASAGSQTIGNHALKTHFGLTLLLDKHNVLDRNIANLGDFENAQISHLTATAKQLIKAGHTPLFLDVGANWGLYSMAMAKAGVRAITAFEPDPRNLAHFRANLLLNGLLESIEILPTAVWHSSGTIRFATTAENADRDRGWAQIVSDETPAIEGKKAKKLATKELPATSLDDAFKGLKGQVVFMKIDTEGAEQQVLAGAAALLKNNAVLLQIENHPHNRKAFLKALPAGLTVVHSIEPDLYLANPAMQKLL